MKPSISSQCIWRWASSVSALVFAFALGCATTSIEPTGGETHFLKLCDPEASEASCGQGLECICGVCTLPCDEQSACSEFPNAECVSIEPSEERLCDAVSDVQHCDTPCSDDDDCNALSTAHVCMAGVCRVGLSNGEPDSAEDGGSEADAASCTPNDIAASEVLLLGDSFFAATHDIGEQLVQVASEAGALSEDETFRDGSSLLDNALALNGEGMTNHYETAKAESPVTVVIMNGGGADALFSECDTADPSCPALEAAADAGRRLFAQMASDGVTDVIYVSYPDPVNADQAEQVRILRPLMNDVCAASPICRWLDLLPIFEGHYDTYVEDNGLEPTPEGARVTALAIWDLMQQRCIAR